MKFRSDFIENLVITLLAFVIGFIAGLSWCGR